jgi:hypothetical protein
MPFSLKISDFEKPLLANLLNYPFQRFLLVFAFFHENLFNIVYLKVTILIWRWKQKKFLRLRKLVRYIRN